MVFISSVCELPDLIEVDLEVVTVLAINRRLVVNRTLAPPQ